MEGLLCRWELALQEYTFEIEYRQCAENGDAVALSRQPEHTPQVQSKVAVTVATSSFDYNQLYTAQQADPVLYIIYQSLVSSPNKPRSFTWCKPPFRCYQHIWHQLVLNNHVVCREYAPAWSY